jgi:threonine 3-dehydrogenase
MKALVKTKAAPGLWLEEVPEPRLEPDDVLVEVTVTGICGTDVHIRNWDAWARTRVSPPTIIGHEFVGRVVEVGANVRQRVALGSVVSAEGHLVCDACHRCASNAGHLCASARGLGIQRDGAFAQYVAVPARNVWVHRAPLDLEHAAIFDPLGNAVHAATTFSVAGEDVLITGAGPVGLMAAVVARRLGARRIVVTDISEYRLALAKTLGADLVLNPLVQSLEAARRDLGIGEGFSVAFEMSGDASALNQLIRNMSHGGRVVALGIPGGGGIDVDWAALVHKMLTIQGVSGREMFRTWHATATLVDGGLALSPIITHRFAFEDHEAAFETATSGQCGKVILIWAGAHDRESVVREIVTQQRVAKPSKTRWEEYT